MGRHCHSNGRAVTASAAPAASNAAAPAPARIHQLRAQQRRLHAARGALAAAGGVGGVEVCLRKERRHSSKHDLVRLIGVWDCGGGGAGRGGGLGVAAARLLVVRMVKQQSPMQPTQPSQPKTKPNQTTQAHRVEERLLPPAPQHAQGVHRAAGAQPPPQVGGAHQQGRERDRRDHVPRVPPTPGACVRACVTLFLCGRVAGWVGGGLGSGSAHALLADAAAAAFERHYRTAAPPHQPLTQTPPNQRPRPPPKRRPDLW